MLAWRTPQSMAAPAARGAGPATPAAPGRLAHLLARPAIPVRAGKPGDRWEREADAVATRAAPGPVGPAVAPDGTLGTLARARVESTTRIDLSGVRVRRDATAQAAAQRLGAAAFTHRDTVFLGAGATPETLEHEAVHAAQQRADPGAPGLQARIVMRSLTPQTVDLGPFGPIRVGTDEQLRTLSDEEVDELAAGIGVRHHELDDLIDARGEEFSFVGGRGYRHDLVVAVIRNLHRVATPMYFDGYPELFHEVRKRGMISLVMRASQGRTPGSSPTGYPRSCPHAGPRVSSAAGAYWNAVPDSANENYHFTLTDTGRDHAYEALRMLLFNHQNDPCLRTLMHCDYMISAQQFYVLARTMGQAEFDRAVHDHEIELDLRWDSYRDIAAEPAASGSAASLQRVELASEDDFVIGDHVIFFNHDAFDDLNVVYAAVRGHASAWRLENAIISDLDTAGRPRFQGHGYFRPKGREEFVHDMVSRMNELVAAARSARDTGRTAALGYVQDDGTRFDVVRPYSSGWELQYHVGMGTALTLPRATMGLRDFGTADYPAPFVMPGEKTVAVYRPIESRRESLSGTGHPTPAPAPAPAPSGPTPAPAPAPAPSGPTPAPAPAPAPSGPTPSGPTPARPAPQRPTQRPPVPAACPVVCSTPHLLGARTPHYASGPDFTFYDFPSLSTWDSIKVAPFRLMPDGLLEFGMNNVLGLLAGADGRAMVAHFRGGSGAMWTHGIGSRLNVEATHCDSVDAAAAAMQTQLAAQARAMRALGRVDCAAFSLAPVPAIHFGFGDSAALKAILGGTQGGEVHLLGMRLRDPVGCGYDLDLEIVVYDDFGVDDSDLYWPALIKFWILQHERPGNRPFVNRLLIRRTVSV